MGIDAARHSRDHLARMIPECGGGEPFALELVAVTPEQARDLNLPTRPTNQSGTRAKGWEGGSTELDVIPPTEPRRIVRECIGRHVDHEQLEQERAKGSRGKAADGGAGAEGLRWMECSPETDLSTDSRAPERSRLHDTRRC